MGFHLSPRVGRVFPVGGVGRKVVTVALGAAAGQAVAVLATPLLTRLYSPGDFGLLGFYLSLLGITSTVSTLTYEKAILITTNEDEARSLLVIALSAVLSTALLIIVVWLILGRLPIRIQTVEKLRPWAWILPIGLIGLGFHQTLAMWGIRERAYQVLARAKFAQGVSSTIFQAGLGLLGGGPLALLSGDALGRLMGSGSLMILGRAHQDLLSAPRHWRKHWRVAMEYRRFPGFGLGSSILNTAGAQGTILLMAIQFDPWQTGLFVFADRLINIPIALVGRAASQVFMGEISQVIRERPGAFRERYLYILKQLSVFGALLALALVFLPPLLVAPLFGERWREAGLLMVILAPAAWAQFVAFPVSECPILLGRLDLQLAWDAGRLVLVVLAIWIPRQLGAGLLPVAACYSAAVTLAYSALLFLIAWAEPRTAEAKA